MFEANLPMRYEPSPGLASLERAFRFLTNMSVAILTTMMAFCWIFNTLKAS
jgi:hypothetical protein